jgi:hypothetical protein
VRCTPMRHPPIRCTLVGCMPVRYVSTFENGFLVLEIFDVALTSLLPAVRTQKCQVSSQRPWYFIPSALRWAYISCLKDAAKKARKSTHPSSTASPNKDTPSKYQALIDQLRVQPHQEKFQHIRYEQPCRHTEKIEAVMESILLFTVTR